MTAAAEVLTQLVRRWWLTGLLAVLGGLAGLVYALVTPPVYTAKAHVIVIAQNEGDGLAAVSYAQAYARVATEGQTVDAAARRSNGTATKEDLQGNVRVASSPNGPVVEITGTASSPSRAAELANLVANGLIDSANRQATQTRMSLSVFSEATPPAVPTSPRPGLAVAVGAASGLLLGGLAVLLGAGQGPITRRRGSAEPGEPAGRHYVVPALDGQRWTGRVPVAVTARAPEADNSEDRDDGRDDPH